MQDDRQVRRLKITFDAVKLKDQVRLCAGTGHMNDGLRDLTLFP